MNIVDFALSIHAQQTSSLRVVAANESALYDTLQQEGIQNLELQILLEELLINSFEHAKDQKVELYFANILNSSYFAIKDSGPGIHRTVPINKNLSDLKNKNPSAIIRMSCEEGITGTGVIGRGIGLSLLQNFCIQNPAESILWSDTGWVLQTGSLFYERQGSPVPEINGTLIALKWGR